MGFHVSGSTIQAENHFRHHARPGTRKNNAETRRNVQATENPENTSVRQLIMASFLQKKNAKQICNHQLIATRIVSVARRSAGGATTADKDSYGEIVGQLKYSPRHGMNSTSCDNKRSEV